jgi:FMN phosphatase YigB (HAD superfamily)
MKIKYVLFDWDGTLGISETREQFIHAKTKEEKLKYLQIHVLEAIKYFHNRNIPMGILSNTHIDGTAIRHAMDVADLSKFFTVQIYTSDPNIPCEKPCSAIFNIAFDMIQKVVPNIEVEDVLYVGNSYFHDICGAWNVGMKTAYIVNENVLKYYIALSLPFQDFVLFTMQDLITPPISKNF